MPICACCLLFFSLASLRRKFFIHLIRDSHTMMRSPLVFSRLNRLMFVSLFLCDKSSGSFIIFVALCWTCYSKSMYLLQLRAHECTQHPWCALPDLSRGEGSPHWPAGNALPKAGILSRWRILKRWWVGKFSLKYIQS